MDIFEKKVIVKFINAGKSLAFWSQEFLKANDAFQKLLNKPQNKRKTHVQGQREAEGS